MVIILTVSKFSVLIYCDTLSFVSLKNIYREKHRQIKLQRLEKVQIGRLDFWYIKSIIC